MFLVLAVLPAHAAAISSAPAWVLEAIDRLKTSGALPLWIGTTRPVSIADLRAALKEASGRGAETLAPGDQVLLERLRHEAGVDIGSIAGRGTLHGGKLGRIYGVDRSYVSLAGAPFSDREWAAGWAVDSVTAGLLVLGGGSFYLGRERLSWGPGGEGGLLFSDAAGPFDRFQYSFGEGALRYTKFIGWLDSGRSLVAARADIMIRPNVRLGLSESIVMQGAPFWVYIVQPVPILINQILGYALRAQQQGIDDNYFAAIDFEWIPRSSLRLFGELLIDDLVLPIPRPNPFPSRWGATLGVHLVQPSGDSFLFQYTIVPNWTYSATNPGAHYLLRGMPLAHPVGADFDAVHVRWGSPPDRPLSAWVTYVRKGEGEVGRIWADLAEATAYPFLRGVVEYSTVLGLDLPVDDAPSWAGRVSPWVRFSQNAGHIAGQAQTDWGVEIAWQSNF